MRLELSSPDRLHGTDSPVVVERRTSPGPRTRSCPNRCSGRGRRRPGRASRRTGPADGPGPDPTGSSSHRHGVHYRRGRCRAGSRGQPPRPGHGDQTRRRRYARHGHGPPAHHAPPARPARRADDHGRGGRRSGRAAGCPTTPCSPPSPSTSPTGPSWPAFAAGAAGAPDGSAWWSSPVPRPAVVEATVAVPDGDIVEWAERDGVRPGAALRRRLPLHPGPEGRPRLAGGHGSAGGSPTSTRSRSTRGRPATSAGPWRTGGAITRCLSLLPGGARPTTATPDRSRVCWPRWTRPGASSSRWSTPGWCPSPPERGSYRPSDNRPTADDLRPLEIAQPDGRELHPGRKPADLAALDACGCR